MATLKKQHHQLNIFFTLGLFFLTALSAKAELVGENDALLTDLAAVYSPSLVMQDVGGQRKTIMYFGGWDTIPSGALPQDTIYRAECDVGFKCTNYKAVINPKGTSLWQVNDPTLIRIDAARPYYIMYMTGVRDIGDPNAGYTVANNKVYYSTSWVDDGVNWSPPTLLLPDVWLPSATLRDGHAYLYGNSNINGLLERYALGPSGTVEGSKETIRVVDKEGKEVKRFYLNVDVTWRNELKFYQILAEYIIDWTEGLSSIDYLTSTDGILWTLEKENVVEAAPGARRVLTPAPHPDSHCWVYYGEKPNTNPVSDINIHVKDWCNGIVPKDATGGALRYEARP